MASKRVLTPKGYFLKNFFLEAAPLLAAAFSAILLLLSFPPFSLSWIGFVGVVPFLWALKRASFFQMLRSAAVFGFIFMSGFHFWLWELTAVGPKWGIGLLWFGYSFYLTVFYIFFGIGAYFFRHQTGSRYVLGVSSLYICCEWLRHLGPIGSPGGLLGYTQVNGLLANLGPWGGVWGTGLACILCSTLIINIRETQKVPFVAVCCSLLFFGLAYAPQPVSKRYITSAVIQNMQTQTEKLSSTHDTIGFFLNKTRDAIAAGATLIVWPETITPTFLYNNTDFVNALKAQLAAKTTVMWGTPVQQGDNFYNAIISTTKTDDTLYLKQKLVPFGEYFPFKKYFKALGLGHVIPGAEYSAATEQPLLREIFGAAICLESVYGWHFRPQVLAGAQAFVVAGNHAWYGSSSAASKHLDIVRFRAIEYQRSILFASTSGKSALILPNGKTKEAIIRTNSLVTGALPLQHAITPYAHYGDVLIGVLTLVILILGFELHQKKKPRSF